MWTFSIFEVLESMQFRVTFHKTMDVTLTTINNVLLLIKLSMWVEFMKVIHHVFQENASTCILHSNFTS